MSSKEEAAVEAEKEDDATGYSQSWASWSSWGQGVLKNLAEKSTSTLGMVKKDLAEFYSTIQHDTATVVAETATKVQEKLDEDEEEENTSSLKTMKQGFSHALAKFSDSIKTLAEAGAQTTFMIDDRKDRASSITQYDRKEAIIYAVQTNPATFSNEPEGAPDLFNTWLEKFDIEKHRGEISDLLVENSDIRAMYIKLVPIVVPHVTFWQRYYYKLHLVEQDEIRRAALVARASSEPHRGDSYSWSDDEDEVSVPQDAKKEDSVIQNREKEEEMDQGFDDNAASEKIILGDSNDSTKPKEVVHHFVKIDNTGSNKLPPHDDVVETDVSNTTSLEKETNNLSQTYPQEGEESKVGGQDHDQVLLSSVPTERAQPEVEVPREANSQSPETSACSTITANERGNSAQKDNSKVSSAEINGTEKSRGDTPSNTESIRKEKPGERQTPKQANDDEQEEDSDLDFDLDDDNDDGDINEEELAEMISKIKADPLEGEDVDEDWESW